LRIVLADVPCHGYADALFRYAMEQTSKRWWSLLLRRCGSRKRRRSPYEAVRKRLAAIGQELPPRDMQPRDMQMPEALAAYHKAEIARWWPVINEASVKAQSGRPALAIVALRPHTIWGCVRICRGMTCVWWRWELLRLYSRAA
jgi:hypothetical protein